LRLDGTGLAAQWNRCMVCPSIAERFYGSRLSVRLVDLHRCLLPSRGRRFSFDAARRSGCARTGHHMATRSLGIASDCSAGCGLSAYYQHLWRVLDGRPYLPDSVEERSSAKIESTERSLIRKRAESQPSFSRYPIPILIKSRSWIFLPARHRCTDCSRRHASFLSLKAIVMDTISRAVGSMHEQRVLVPSPYLS
jgi:hypothetical protein